MFILCCSCSNLNIMKYNDSKKTVTFFSQLLLAALEVMNIIYVALFFFFSLNGNVIILSSHFVSCICFDYSKTHTG